MGLFQAMLNASSLLAMNMVYQMQQKLFKICFNVGKISQIPTN